jgi:hypothetical protein
MIFNRPTRAIPNTTRPKNQAKFQHWDDRNTLLSPHHISFQVQRGVLIINVSKLFTVDSGKNKKLIDIFLLRPATRVDDAMRMAEFTEEDITNLRIWRFLQRSLPGGSIKGLKAYVARLLLPPQPQPPAAHPRPKVARAAPSDEVVTTAGTALSSLSPAAHPQQKAARAAPPEEVVTNAGTVLSSLLLGTARKAKRKCWNSNHYHTKKNKLRGLLLPVVPTITTTTTTTTTTMMTEMVMPILTTMTSTTATTTAMMAAPPCWLVGAFGSVRTSGAAKMARLRLVKPVVERILRGSGLKDHADLLRAVVDHPMVAAA